MKMSISTHGPRLFWLASTLIAVAAGCSGPAELGQPEQTAAANPVSEVQFGPGPNDGLNSTLWALRSAEYKAVAETIYSTAEQALERGLADPSWTALPEQMEVAGYSELPTAVVLDADETVLDNGAYQVGLVLENALYSSETWLEWVLKEQAGAIPGALEFTKRADAMGITVIYLTNRRGPMEDATRRNLLQLGFPVDTTFDVVLTRGERPEWSHGEKSSRRNFVAEHFRILAFLGDNLGDFIDIDGLDLAQRDQTVAKFASYWGSKWFMLPNPLYGSWEAAAIDGQFRLPPAEQRRLKLEQLRKVLER